MYPRPKKNATGWALQIFMICSILVLAGVLLWVYLVTSGSEVGFRGLSSGDEGFGIQVPKD